MTKNKLMTVLALALGLTALATTSVAATSGDGHDSLASSRATTAAPVEMDTMKMVSDTAERSASTHHHRVHRVLRDVQGNRVGTIDIWALKPGRNVVSIQAWNVTPGFHGVHIHSVGVCDPAGVKPFASAGGHFNPAGTSEGMQAGAFPVLLAGSDGRAQAEFIDSNFTIGQLAGATGASIVIHAAADNYANIPARYNANGIAGPDSETQMTGDGGARIACSVIFPARALAPSPSQTGTPMVSSPAETTAPSVTSSPSMSSMSAMDSPATTTSMP